MPNTTVWRSIASTYRFWLSVLGRTARPRELTMFCVRISAAAACGSSAMPMTRSTVSLVSP